MSYAGRQERSTPCAMGIRTHSGWGAIVVLCVENGAAHVLQRRRLEIIDPATPGAAQPYHFAEKLRIDAAQKHLKVSAENSFRLALRGIREIVEALREQNYDLRVVALLLSSGRSLPDLTKILASHALIHAAEGEFFRGAFRGACQEMHIPITGIPERDLDNHADAVFGGNAQSIRLRIGELGRALGPPWTQDQKSAALAAAIVLGVGALNAFSGKTGLTVPRS